VSGIPIKLHSLAEKASIIKNVDECLLTYNHWISSAGVPYALPHTPQALLTQAMGEVPNWRVGDMHKLVDSTINTNTLLLADLKSDQ
jgi:hypothetical protein